MATEPAEKVRRVVTRHPSRSSRRVRGLRRLVTPWTSDDSLDRASNEVWGRKKPARVLARGQSRGRDHELHARTARHDHRGGDPVRGRARPRQDLGENLGQEVPGRRGCRWLSKILQQHLGRAKERRRWGRRRPGRVHVGPLRGIGRAIGQAGARVSGEQPRDCATERGDRARDPSNRRFPEPSFSAP